MYATMHVCIYVRMHVCLYVFVYVLFSVDGQQPMMQVPTP